MLLRFGKYGGILSPEDESLLKGEMMSYVGQMLVKSKSLKRS